MNLKPLCFVIAKDPMCDFRGHAWGPSMSILPDVRLTNLLREIKPLCSSWTAYLSMPNFHYNRNPQRKVHSEPENLGVSVSFRLSETLIAVCLSAGISFGSGFAVASNQNQNVNNCVQNTSTQKR